MMRWLFAAAFVTVLACGCEHTGKRTYDHNADDYVVNDYLHTGVADADYHDRSWSSEHRSHYHP